MSTCCRCTVVCWPNHEFGVSIRLLAWSEKSTTRTRTGIGYTEEDRMNSGSFIGLRELPYFKWEGAAAELPSTLRKLVGTRVYQNLKSAYGWLKHERTTPTSLPLSRKLKVWRRGFFAESAALYDLERNDPEEYLSDFMRAARWREINAHNDFFAHKLVLRSFLLAMGFRQAETVALIFQGKIVADPFSRGARHI